jgi:hypothetical protein
LKPNNEPAKKPPMAGLMLSSVSLKLAAAAVVNPYVPPIAAA